mmetsp:Transcript_23899/g.52321  ORF Transcript_23899/g.52321 Transcript_23899/m.52321 type:complete len:218 (-) Transcript_23899:453-1106(-)
MQRSILLGAHHACEPLPPDIPSHADIGTASPCAPLRQHHPTHTSDHPCNSITSLLTLKRCWEWLRQHHPHTHIRSPLQQHHLAADVEVMLSVAVAASPHAHVLSPVAPPYSSSPSSSASASPSPPSAACSAASRAASSSASLRAASSASALSLSASASAAPLVSSVPFNSRILACRARSTAALRPTLRTCLIHMSSSTPSWLSGSSTSSLAGAVMPR